MSSQVAKQTFASVSSDDPRFSITFNYELIDDAYCLFDDDEDDDDEDDAGENDNILRGHGVGQDLLRNLL